MGDEILQLKPNVYGMGIDLKALWRRWRGKNNHDSLDVVAERFLQLFLDHGVAVVQIPRLVPGMALDSLRTPERLLAALKPEILDHTAGLFGIRAAWLEGIDDQIYDFHHCYKQPQILFDELATYFVRDEIPVRVIIGVDSLDNGSGAYQPLVLVTVEPVAQLGEETIQRYRIYDQVWDWAHPPCRLQLKATARMLFHKLGKPVPIFSAKPADVEAMGKGRRVPRDLMRGSLITTPSLEDYTLSLQESAVAKEVEELPDVLRYIAEYCLDEVC